MTKKGRTHLVGLESGGSWLGPVSELREEDGKVCPELAVVETELGFIGNHRTIL